MKRRSLLLTAMSLPVAASAQSEAASRKLGVLSVIGDRLLIVHHLPQVGSIIDSNRHEYVPLPTTELDDAALIASKGVLDRAKQPAPAFYRAPDPKLFDDIVNDGAIAIPSVLKAAFVQDNVSQVLLFTKLKGPARFEFNQGNGKVFEGTGSLEGIGFYLDHTYRARRSDTNEAGIGFLAPFIYMSVSLMEVASGRVLHSEPVRDSRALSAARNGSGADVWGTLSSEQKVGILREMITEAVGRVVPKVISS